MGQDELEQMRFQTDNLSEIARQLTRIADFFAFFETAWAEADELVGDEDAEGSDE